MTIEQRLAEIIQAFCADALSSTVNLNVDLDVVLCVLAQALLAAFRNRLGPGYAAATPDTLQRRFLDTAGTITSDGDTITVTLTRRAYSPVLRQASLPPDTTVPGGKTAACASSSASAASRNLCFVPAGSLMIECRGWWKTTSVFEGFQEDRIDLDEASIFVRHGGDGPPVVLLHGHPRTSATWHRVAPRLVRRGFTVICPDLPGYGQSRAPAPAADHTAHSPDHRGGLRSRERRFGSCWGRPPQ